MILPWMDLTAERELSYYRDGIDSDSIAKFKDLILKNKVPRIGFFCIEQGRFSYHCTPGTTKRCEIVAAKIKELNEKNRLDDNVFFVGLDDSWDYLPSLELDFTPPPILVFASDDKFEHRRNYILFVDDHTIGTSYIGYRRGWKQIHGEVMTGNDRYPWSKKKKKAVWRGAPTDVSRYQGLSPRNKLVEFSELNQDLLDARFTQTRLFNTLVRKVLRPVMQKFGIRPFMTISRQVAYKMVINVDGMSATYPGLLWRLLSSSVTIKQTTSRKQWFYHLFSPWQHYVPCEEGFDDLEERIDWVLEHDEKAREMAELSTRVVEQNITPSHVDSYIVSLLNKHAELRRLKSS